MRVVIQNNIEVVKKLRVLPMFRGVRFVKPGRLLTAKEFAARQAKQRQADSVNKSFEIAEFLSETIGQMNRIAESVELMNRSRNYRLRKIRNHSRGRRGSIL
jgi:hypothetical protein